MHTRWPRDWSSDVCSSDLHGEPALQNNSDVIEWIKQTIQDFYLDFSIYEGPYGLGSEDFSYVTQAMPGAMFFLGCKMKNDKERDLHTADFDIDEDCLPYGVAILAETALRYLNGTYTRSEEHTSELQ